MAGKHFEIPLIVTEQYPERLGKTIAELDVSHASGCFAKSQFSMMTSDVTAKVKQIYPTEASLQSVVLFGIEVYIFVREAKHI